MVEETKGKNTNVGNEETKSNGKIYNINSMELVETIRNLRMEVQSCKSNNKRMLNDLEHQNQLNTKLMQHISSLQIQM